MAADKPRISSDRPGVIVRSPFVYWAQTENAVTLRVDIRNAQNPRVHIAETKICFDSIGEGAQGQNEYHFELDFPHAVNPKVSTYRVLDRDIDILLQKEDKGWWEKVTLSHKKPAWLKVDFDRWKSQDDEDMVPQDVMKDFPDLLESLKRDEFGYKIESLRSVYLFMYNLFQFVMNLFIIGVLSVKYSRDGQAAFYKAYEDVGSVFRYSQLIQCMEILHPLLGFTKTSIGPALLQIIGRNFILFALISTEERIQPLPVVFILFYIWSLADLIRYPFYMLQIYKVNFYPLLWLRYSAWILLYPAGIACEAIVIFASIPLFVETGRYSLALPNNYNMTFHFPSIMRGYLLFGIIPIAYALLQNMKRARSKALKCSKKPIQKTN